MKLDVYHHFGESNILEALLEKMEAILEKVNINTHQLNHVKMTTQEAVDIAKATRAELAKIKKEVQALKDLASTKKDVDPELAEALNGISTDTKEIDDLNEDATTGDTGTTPPDSGNPPA